MSAQSAAARRSNDALGIAPYLDLDPRVEALRLLITVAAHNGNQSKNALTLERLAYFDYLLKSPGALVRVLMYRRRSLRQISAVGLRDAERDSMEAHISGLRLQPWTADLRRRVAGLLAISAVAMNRFESKTLAAESWGVRLAPKGQSMIEELGDPFADDRRRANIIAATLDIQLRSLRICLAAALPESVSMEVTP